MAQNNQEFERLKQKYQPALNLMQQLQVQVQNINMEGTKLLIRGVAPSAEVKNRIWDQIKLIDATFSDLICDISVSQQQRQPDAQQAPATMTAGASVSGRPKPAALYRQTGRYSFQNQPRVLWRCQSVHEDIQRQSQCPAGSEHDQPRSGIGDSGVSLWRGWTQSAISFNRYSGAAGGTASAPADPHQDYRDIAEAAPPQVMADALAHTFRSEQTPSFPEMVSSLFRQSNPDQRAGAAEPAHRSDRPCRTGECSGVEGVCRQLQWWTERDVAAGKPDFTGAGATGHRPSAA